MGGAEIVIGDEPCTLIPEAVLDAIIPLDLTSHPYRVLLSLIGLTYRAGSDGRIPLEALHQMTGIKRWYVSAVLDELTERKLAEPLGGELYRLGEALRG